MIQLSCYQRYVAAPEMVKVDKCSVFGTKKSKTESAQYQPYAAINRERVQPIKNGDSFTYLGKDFNLNINCNRVKKKFNKNHSWLYQQNR